MRLPSRLVSPMAISGDYAMHINLGNGMVAQDTARREGSDEEVHSLIQAE